MTADSLKEKKIESAINLNVIMIVERDLYVHVCVLYFYITGAFILFTPSTIIEWGQKLQSPLGNSVEFSVKINFSPIVPQT